jgi:hypothetical protein
MFQGAKIRIKSLLLYGVFLFSGILGTVLAPEEQSGLFHRMFTCLENTYLFVLLGS